MNPYSKNLSITLSCEGKQHTFYAYNLQETWRAGKYLFVQKLGTINVYDTTQFDKTNTSGYKCVKDIQFYQELPLSAYDQRETLLTNTYQNPWVNNIDQSYSNYKRLQQQKQLQNLNPETAYYANALPSQAMNRPSQPIDVMYNPDTRKIYDGFSAKNVEFYKPYH